MAIGDLVATKHTTLDEHTVDVVDPSASDYTVVVTQTIVAIVAAVQTTSAGVAMMQTAVKVVVEPPTDAAVVFVLLDVILPLHSRCPLFFIGVDNMHGNPYLHAQQTDQIYSINSWAS